jgi:hypothetical protein
MTSSDGERDRWTAYHEAGHAVAAILCLSKLGGVTLEPVRDPDGRIGSGGCAYPRPTDESVNREGVRAAWGTIVVDLCGAEGERLEHEDERAITAGFESDEIAARRLAELACRSPRSGKWEGRHEALIQVAREEASRFIFAPEHAALVRIVAEALLVHRKLSGGKASDMVIQRYPQWRQFRLPWPPDA